MKRDGGTCVKSQSLRIQNVDIALKNTCTFERTARIHLSFPPQMHTKYHLLKKGHIRKSRGILRGCWESPLCSHNSNSDMKRATQNIVEVYQIAVSRVKLTSPAARKCISVEAFKERSLSV